ncbi:MAG: DnaJ C-terminal domain-containing protein [Gammaproteobacteria bacterium]
MEFRDYYQILGVEKAATAPQVKASYRKLARKFHPDVSKEPDAARRMTEVNEAYAVLSDPEKRAAYDQIGSGRQAGEQFQPPPDWGAGFEYSGAGPGAGPGASQGTDYSEFFSSLFGTASGARGPQQQRGGDHHAKIAIELVDAYNGATRQLTLRSAAPDESGRVAVRERNLTVRVPKGVTEGQFIRLAGQGSPGFGEGPAGDLYLEVVIAADPRYRLEGRDVHQSVPVTPWEAALGGAIEVQTPGGRVQVKIPPGSQAGRKLRLKGRGIPGGTPGDLYLGLNVVLPPATTDKARELYATMARELAFDPRQGTGAES